MKNSEHIIHCRKIRSEIVKDILGALLIGGFLVIAVASPFFIVNIVRGLRGMNKHSNKKVRSAFDNLKKQGLINFDNRGGQIYIELTEKGKQKASWMKINDMEIKKPKKWDRKWRMVMFDISQIKRESREALRGKLKQLGFYLFQKSIWVIPYNCYKEIEMLKNFFGLKDYEIRLITIDDIGNDKELKIFFEI